MSQTFDLFVPEGGFSEPSVVLISPPTGSLQESAKTRPNPHPPPRPARLTPKRGDNQNSLSSTKAKGSDGNISGNIIANPSNIIKRTAIMLFTEGLALFHIQISN